MELISPQWIFSSWLSRSSQWTPPPGSYFHFVSFLVFIFKASSLLTCFSRVNGVDLFSRNRVAVWCCSCSLTVAEDVGIDAGEDWMGVERDASADSADHKFSIHKCFGSTNLREQIFAWSGCLDTKKPVASDRLGDGGNQFIANSTLSIVVHLILLNMVAISLLLLEANQ